MSELVFYGVSCCLCCNKTSQIPVLSAERVRQVIVHSGTSLQSSDHDFTTSSIIPSAVLLSEIPADTSESWYDGEVKVMFNEGAFI